MWGDDLDEVLLHLKKVQAVIATTRARATADDPTATVEELPQCRKVPSALRRGRPGEAAAYCHEHDTRFFRNVWKNGQLSWSHRKANGSWFCRDKG